MKVLHIISSGGMYGAEAVILNLSRAHNESGHSSMLAVFANSPNPNLQLHEAAQQEGIESHLISCNGQIDRTVTRSIRELVNSTGADVVHAHGYKADVYTYFALRKTKTPFVSTCHNWIDDNLSVVLYGNADRFILRSYAGVIAVSDAVKVRLVSAGVNEKKIALIRNGIDLRPFANAIPSLRTDDRLTVGWIGRLSNEKGPDIFLRAAQRVLTECPDARFILVGDGPDLEMLKMLAKELAIEESVTFAGRRQDMPAVYASLDVMVSSSRQEGLPMAILEGMASGLPLVATAVGDVSTLVREGSTGFLTRSEDVESIADGITKLLQNPELRKQFGAAGREVVRDEFSAGRMAKEYLRVYEKVIAEKSQSSLNTTHGEKVAR
ncbi:MAG TPA: glycosyltransferase family 4 protein [Edaphobacter sp.]|nr:glycosyltransferase family 4 protein [Edaphobacter sp.]